MAKDVLIFSAPGRFIGRSQVVVIVLSAFIVDLDPRILICSSVMGDSVQLFRLMLRPCITKRVGYRHIVDATLPGQAQFPKDGASLQKK